MQTKKTKTSKLMISLIVVIALTATSVTQLLPTAAFDISDGPMITIKDPKYEGMAPPFDWEGELEDYDGELVPATWIDYTTPINVSALGADDGWTRLFYRVWNFGLGWMTGGPYTTWVDAGAEYVEFDMSSIPTPFVDHPCWHKVEAYYENGIGEESAHTSVWMYLDPDPPTTANWTDGCVYYATDTYPIPTEEFTGSIPGGWTTEGSWGYDAGNGGCVYNPTPGGDEHVWSPLVTGSGGGEYILEHIYWSNNAGNSLDIGWDEDTTPGGFTLLTTVSGTTGSTFDPQAPYTFPEPAATGNDFYLCFRVGAANPGGVAIDDVNLTYNSGITELCLNVNSTVYLNATDGPWYVENGNCSSGVNYTEYYIYGSGDDTGWVKYDGMVNLSLLENDCAHTMEYRSVDFMGNTEAINYLDFNFDNTPPMIMDYTVTADYSEDVNAFKEGEQPLWKAKNMTEGCVNITVAVDPGVDCCPSEEIMVYLLVTRPDPSPDDPEALVDIMVEMIQIGDTLEYYFDWCNDSLYDIRCNNLMENNTRYPGKYTFEIIVEDCIGNNVTIEDYFLIKPLCDVDIIELVEPDPEIWHPEMPRQVKVLIKNNGILDVPGPINTHLQIYEETNVPLDDLYCFDMESCIVSGMWEAISWDEGPPFDTWTWTELRSNSPTHSWHSQPDSFDAYEGHSRDSLILANGTQGLYIPERCPNDARTYDVYLNFSHWAEGEAYDDTPVDYGQVFLRTYETGLDNGDRGTLTDEWLDWYYGAPDYHVTSEQYVDLDYPPAVITKVEIRNFTDFVWYEVTNFADYIINIDGTTVIFSPDMYASGDFRDGYRTKVYYEAWGDWYETDDEDVFYDTGGAWEDVSIDITNISDNNIIGKWIQVNFTWYADYTDNREGWYIDDVCIKTRCGSPQPLVFQGYKYVENLLQNETREISYPLNFTPKPDTYYYFEIYSDLQCCSYEDECLGDYDGPADKEGEFVLDDRTETEYWDPYNGVNHSLFFGDVCDAAINSVTIPDDEYILDHTSFDGYVSIPIEVEVENTGTLTKEVPVVLKVQEKLTNVIAFDDMESGVLPEWDVGYITGESTYEDLWEITDEEYYSPTHSWYMAPADWGIGQAKRWEPIEKAYDITGGLKIEANIKYNLPEATDEVGAFPYMLAESYFWDFGGISIDDNDHFDDMAVDRVDPWGGESGWFHFDADEFIQTYDLYWEERYGNATDYPEYVDYFNEDGGFDSLDMLMDFWKARYEDEQGSENFDTVQFGFAVEAPEGLEEDHGFWFDDFRMYSEYPGAVIYEETKIAMGAEEDDETYDGLDQNEIETLEFTWNATDYCDYIVTAEVALDCDIDPSNNLEQDSVRIHEVLYEIGEYEKIEFEDNTCIEDDDWHLTEECSICPDDQFWWCGDDAIGLYNPDSNDVLMINHTFDLSGASYATLTFEEYYAIEDEFDYGYVEITNDSGEHWFIIRFLDEAATGFAEDIEWETTVLNLIPGSTILVSEYTGGGFGMPTTFFTDEMQLRFRFYSDAITEWKGWYIDDVVFTVDGTTTLFSDDMEDADSSLENWTHAGACPGGNHWHNESAFGDGTDAPWWWNGEPKYWETLGLEQVFVWPDGPTWPDPIDADDFVTYTDNGGDGTWDLTNGDTWWVFDSGSKADQEDDWLNITVTLPDSPYIELTVAPFIWDGQSWALGGTHDVGVANATTYENFDQVGGHPWSLEGYEWYYGGNFGPTWPGSVIWYGCAPWYFDISPMAGETINITLHMTTTMANWYSGHTSCAPFEIWAFQPGFNSIPYQEYYPNVDEKVIYTFDLTQATEAILYFDQNYTFADENDLGYVEISTDEGETWQAILVNKGTSGGWLPVMLDISQYAGGDVPVKIRWRFVSNESGADYGWLFDNVWIDGKVDYTDPMITATLSPAAPNGNNDWYTSDVTVTLTATDNMKVDSIKYRIDGGSWLTYTAPFSIGIEGEHTIEYYAIDSVGNEGAIGSVSFKIDKTAPTGSINVPQAGYIYFFGRELMPRILFRDKALIIGGLAAEASASDSTSGVYVVKFNEDGTTFAEDTTSPYAAPLPFSLFGSHELTMTVVDAAGNSYTTASVPYFKVF